MPPRIPMMVPNPPRLSENAKALNEIERSGLYSNYGPVNTQFERALISTMFGEGACVTVCNATIGLILAIREVLGVSNKGKARYALMPSFTFAATGQAALWNGLTPLFCDIDSETWLPCVESEEALIAEYGDDIGVIVPYATFGNNLDLDRYERLSAKYDIPIVVDAAASLGSLDERGRQFGAGCSWPIVFSMHATKLFAVGEGGIIYCNEKDRISRLRSMGSFGFGGDRQVTQLGLNSKLSEVTALTALLQLNGFEAVVNRRSLLAAQYIKELPNWTRQQLRGERKAHAFESVLLPERMSKQREQIIANLHGKGIGCGCYFSPHLAEQPYFDKVGVSGSLTTTQSVSQRILTLPMFDTMSSQEVETVSAALLQCCSEPDGLRGIEIVESKGRSVKSLDAELSRTPGDACVSE